VSIFRSLLLAVCLAGAALAGARASTDGADPSSRRLGSALYAYLRERSTEPIHEIAIPPLGDLAREAERADREVVFSVSPEQPILGSVPVTVSLWRGARLEKRSIVTARVSVERPTVVARRPLRSGEVLAAEDLAVEPRAVATPASDTVEEPSDAVDLRVRRAVPAGDPLRRSWLDEAPRVRRGDRVKLRLVHGALRIEGAGRAEQDGREGEWIRVRNLGSKREVIGRVADDGVVDVAL